jgi:hypothetical protein
MLAKYNKMFLLKTSLLFCLGTMGISIFAFKANRSMPEAFGRSNI